MKILFLVFLSLFAFYPVAYASGPIGSAIQGTLYDPSGHAVTSSDVDITIQIFDKDNKCVLYEETHSGVDLSLSRGNFSISLGAGNTRSNKIDNSSSLKINVFQNGTNNVTVSGCSSTVTFADGDERKIRLIFIADASTASPIGPITLTPDLKLGSSPYSSVAATLNGKADSDFLQVKTDTNYVLNQSNLEYAFSSTNFPRLQSLLTAGQTLTNIGAPTAGTDAVNKNYADSKIGGKSINLSGIGPAVGEGKILRWDATANSWVASDPTTGITSLTGDVVASGSGSVAATITAAAVTNAKIANGAISSAKIDTNYAVNRFVATDGTTGANLTYFSCTNLNEIPKWTAMGWQCSSVSVLAPVTSVSGKTGAITININDVDGLGSAAARFVGTANGNLIEITNSGLPAVDGSQLTNLNATRLQARSVASAAPTSGQVLMWNGSQWEPTTPSTSADNLGNHTATQNLALNGNWLSGDGGNEGIYVNSSGNVGVGTTPSTSRLAIGNIDADPGFTSNTSVTLAYSGKNIGDNWGLSIGQDAMHGLNFWWNNHTTPASATAHIDTSSYNNPLYIDSPELILQSQTNGKVGIGTTSPDATLSVSGVASGTSPYALHIGNRGGSVTTSYGLKIDNQTAGSANNFNLWSGPSFSLLSPDGCYGQCNADGSSAVVSAINTNWQALSAIGEGSAFGMGFFAGGNVTASNPAAGAQAVAMQAQAGFTGASGTLDSAWAFDALIGGKAGGTINEAVDFHASNPFDSAAITKLYGLKVENLNRGGSNYAIYTAQNAGTSNYAFYAAGSAQSYFAGNVGIGTTSPSAKLEVSSGSANVSGLKFTNFNSGSPTGSGQAVGVDSSGNLITISASSGSGTVNSGTSNQLAYYSANGSTVGGLATANNGVLVTDGTGAPSIGSTLPTAVQSNITRTGTVTSGTWNGSAISVAYGGTGLSSGTSGGVPYFSAAGTMASSAALSTNQVVLGGGAGSAPTVVSGIGTAGQVLTSNGAGSAPTWQSAATDNLGNHTASQNILLGNYWLSGDGGNEGVSVAADGKVGIGTVSPKTKLEVFGDIRIGTSTTVCDGTTEGAFRYNSTGKNMEFCNGTDWTAVASGSSLPSCADGDFAVASSGSWICSSTVDPAPFDFTDIAGASLNTLYTSTAVQINGFSGSRIANISGDGSPQYRVCWDYACSVVAQNWTSSSSSIQSNQYIQIRMTSSSLTNTTSTLNISIGSRTADWIVSTSSMPQLLATNMSAQSASEVTSHTIALPAGVTSGELLVIVIGVGRNVTISTPAGWTQLFTSTAGSGASSYQRFSGFYKVANGSEGSSVSVTTSSSAYSAHHSFRISGFSGTPEYVLTAATSGSTTPNPPALTPSWGSKATLWIATSMIRDTGSYNSYPAGYSGGMSNGNTGSYSVKVGSAYLVKVTNSEDPGTFTTSDSRIWTAVTIGVSP